MSSLNKKIKLICVLVFAAVAFCWLASGSLSTSASRTAADSTETIAELGQPPDDNYVGSETCALCHEPQAKSVAHTKHGKLGGLESWKGKVTGCETCHGPGKAHVEAEGDPTKIISFKKMSSKNVSETCLACHAGKEAHNNFRRGEHWRNNVGCTDCHTAHGAEYAKAAPESIAFVASATHQNPGVSEEKMLKASEPQLCMTCHNETKQQFSKPFHHKVLEGTMTCSDCHNPHGGFEQKQTKLALGADASCIKCHANKAGPFVFEHGPLKLEGCTACHAPHGATNARLLKRPSVRQTCFECHTGISDELAPGVPSRHNQAQLREQQCTVCHSAIHGSNSSSLFFR